MSPSSLWVLSTEELVKPTTMAGSHRVPPPPLVTVCWGWWKHTPGFDAAFSTPQILLWKCLLSWWGELNSSSVALVQGLEQMSRFWTVPIVSLDAPAWCYVTWMITMEHKEKDSNMWLSKLWTHLFEYFSYQICDQTANKSYINIYDILVPTSIAKWRWKQLLL